MKIKIPRPKIFAVVLIAVFIVLALFVISISTKGNSKPYVWVDADPGVVDTFALAYLLKNPDEINMLGISVVYGNTTVENGVKNVLTLMDVMNRHDVPVHIGSSKPLLKPPTNLGMLVHGFDGIWGQQQSHDISNIPTDAPAAIAEAARNNPGMILLAIGPATNIALAVQQYPEDMKKAKIYMLAEITGNEYNRVHSDPFPGGFNTWIDPDAVDVVLNTPGLDFTIFRGGAYDGITVDANEYANELKTKGGSLGQFLESIATPSWQMTSQGAGGPIVLDDLILAILGTHPDYITKSIKGYAKVSVHHDYTGGTYYFADNPYSKVILLGSDQELSELANNYFTQPNYDIQLKLQLFLIMSRAQDNLNVLTGLKGSEVLNTIKFAFNEN